MGQPIVSKRTGHIVGRAISLSETNKKTKKMQKIFPEKNHPHSSCGPHLRWQGRNNEGRHVYMCRVCGELHIKNK